MKEHFIIASKNLRKRKLRSWLTIVGIFIGIAAVISLISLSEGLKQAITGQFATLDTDKLIIENIGTGFGPPGSTVVNKLNEHDLDIIKSSGNIKQILPRLIRVAKIEYNKNLQFNFIVNVPENKKSVDLIKEVMNIEVLDGRILEENDKGKVILGNDFTDENKFGKKIKIGDNIKIQGNEFEVIGILEKASSFEVNSVVLMMEKDMKKTLNIDDEIDIIVVQIEDEKKIDETAKEIERKMRKDRGLKEGEEDFSVQTPVKAIENVNTILNIVGLVVSGIAAISLLVGGIGIANTMYTSVLERTKEIGVMKAIGAKNSDILSIFLIESGLLGLIGGVIGIIFGVGMGYLISSLVGGFIGIEIKLFISYSIIFGAVGFSFLVGMIAGILPAIQASKLNVVDALRSGR